MSGHVGKGEADKAPELPEKNTGHVQMAAAAKAEQDAKIREAAAALDAEGIDDEQTPEDPQEDAQNEDPGEVEVDAPDNAKDEDQE